MIVELRRLPVVEGRVEIPDGTPWSLLEIEFRDEGGLGQRRRPCGVWIAIPCDE